MFDPTIYDNIKVVLEGEIYELDLAGEITVIERKDIIDLARMSRTFLIQFKLTDAIDEKIAELQLLANTDDLSKEILEMKGEPKPGCEIKIRFITKIYDPEIQCNNIQDALNKVWDFRPEIVQRLSYTYQKGSKELLFDEIILNFGRKIDEDNIADIHNLAEYTLHSLNAIHELEKSKN